MALSELILNWKTARDIMDISTLKETIMDSQYMGHYPVTWNRTTQEQILNAEEITPVSKYSPFTCNKYSLHISTSWKVCDYFTLRLFLPNSVTLSCTHWIRGWLVHIVILGKINRKIPTPQPRIEFRTFTLQSVTE